MIYSGLFTLEPRTELVSSLRPGQVIAAKNLLGSSDHLIFAYVIGDVYALDGETVSLRQKSTRLSVGQTLVEKLIPDNDYRLSGVMDSRLWLLGDNEGYAISSYVHQPKRRFWNYKSNKARREQSRFLKEDFVYITEEERKFIQNQIIHHMWRIESSLYANSKIRNLLQK